MWFIRATGKGKDYLLGFLIYDFWGETPHHLFTHFVYSLPVKTHVEAEIHAELSVHSLKLSIRVFS